MGIKEYHEEQDAGVMGSILETAPFSHPSSGNYNYTLTRPPEVVTAQ